MRTILATLGLLTVMGCAKPQIEPVPMLLETTVVSDSTNSPSYVGLVKHGNKLGFLVKDLNGILRIDYAAKKEDNTIVSGYIEFNTSSLTDYFLQLPVGNCEYEFYVTDRDNTKTMFYLSSGAIPSPLPEQ